MTCHIGKKSANTSAIKIVSDTKLSDMSGFVLDGYVQDFKQQYR